MNNIQFTNLVEDRIKLIRQVLTEKGQEYNATDSDRLYNFDLARRVAPWLITNEEEYMLVLALKHFGSVIDILQGQKLSHTIPSESFIREKFGDLINYLILIETSLVSKARVEQEYNEDLPF